MTETTKRTADAIAADILQNAADGWDERISFDEFKARANALWDEARAGGEFVSRRVMALVDARVAA